MTFANSFRISGLGALAGVMLALPAAAEPLNIRIGWSNMPAHMIPVLFLKADLLENYGESYVIEPIAFSGSSPQIVALAADQIHISTMSPSALALAVQNAGLDLRMFADVVQEHRDHKNTYLFVREDSGIREIADLRGKRVATNVQGSSLDVTVRMMLRRGGLDPARDVNLIEVRFPEAPAMLAEDKVDFAPVIQPFAQGLLASGGYVEIAEAADIQGGATQSVFLAAKADFIAEHRDVLVDFVEDYIRVVRWFVDSANREEAIGIIADYMQVSPDRLSIQFTADDSYRHPWAEPTIEGAQLAIDNARSVGMYPGEFTIADYTDLSLIQDARQRIEE